MKSCDAAQQGVAADHQQLGSFGVRASDFYETAALALENLVSLEFTLGIFEKMLFLSPDGANAEKLGGLSLGVAQVPEPGTVLFLLVGVLGLDRYRRVACESLAEIRLADEGAVEGVSEVVRTSQAEPRLGGQDW